MNTKFWIEFVKKNLTFYNWFIVTNDLAQLVASNKFVSRNKYNDQSYSFFWN